MPEVEGIGPPSSGGRLLPGSLQADWSLSTKNFPVEDPFKSPSGSRWKPANFPSSSGQLPPLHHSGQISLETGQIPDKQIP